VHKASSPTNESFIHFNVLSFSAKFLHASRLQSQTETVKNKPCGLLGDSQIAAHFIGANPVLAVDQHPKSGEPLVERDSRVLENSSEFDSELLVALRVLALPAQLRREIVMLFAATLRADWAIGPAKLSNRVNASLFIAKVPNRLL
jgi:hypothetical protein